MKKTALFLVLLLSIISCQTAKEQTSMSSISDKTIKATIDSVKTHAPEADFNLIVRGVTHAAKFWQTEDGSETDFLQFCVANFAGTKTEKQHLFTTIQTNLEVLLGNYNKISVDLKLPLHVVGTEVTPMDEQFGALDPFAHFSDDMFASKIAFTTLLNFPFYTLEEKNELGKTWNRQEWAYARLGDLFNARIPAEINQNIAKQSTEADSYISNYNIMMGQLRTEQGEQLFPNHMALISHWGLRDELKSNYANADGRGLEKQQMIYEVMKHIVNQTIPQQVISNANYTWQPLSNTMFENGKAITPTPEPNRRYEKLYNIYKATIAADAYCPTYPTYIQRSFDQQMEVSAEEIEAMFTQFIASPQVTEVAKVIETRLGRKLQPFDVWYDGFKSRSAINEDELTAQTRKRYPTKEAYEQDLPNILKQLGFSDERAHAICSKIQVDASRGAGHAWGALMKSDKARLRTRIATDGMDYKGYNIATHEFGHNVEQTITLHDVDNYIMNGVPSTAFTEALAFVFQKRDLDLLGYKNNDRNQTDLQTLDIFWGCYEIMGVSLVDLYTWQWLYANPNATVDDLKATIITYATTIWNRYYAPILGEENSPILAIYSHMIDVPLYLPNYPYGHIIEFQLENHLQGKNLGNEIQRIYPVGRLTPNHWMQHALGHDVSTTPLLEATSKALKNIN
ncbi:MAG TPA: hypothetical protein PLJ40_03035 [Paludibacteraceae bacterium]|nr:hypothetical protein [Paludibacteraceae bacterium]HQB69073.1 hypothetical protein [Paludibacteraceae bacterium]